MALVDPTVSFNPAVVIEVDRGLHELLAELARLDRQRRNVAGHLLTVSAKDHLENCLCFVVERAVHEHHQVFGPAEWGSLGRGSGELHAGEVYPGCRTGHLTHGGVVNEQGSNDVHPGNLAPAPSSDGIQVVRYAASDDRGTLIGGSAWRTVTQPNRCITRIAHQEGSNSPGASENRADVGAA